MFGCLIANLAQWSEPKIEAHNLYSHKHTHTRHVTQKQNTTLHFYKLLSNVMALKTIKQKP